MFTNWLIFTHICGEIRKKKTIFLGCKCDFFTKLYNINILKRSKPLPKIFNLEKSRIRIWLVRDLLKRNNINMIFKQGRILKGVITFAKPALGNDYDQSTSWETLRDKINNTNHSHLPTASWRDVMDEIRGVQPTPTSMISLYLEHRLKSKFTRKQSTTVM